MWIVRLALRRPYTFLVLAVLILIVGPLAILRTPTGIFQNINIPVVNIVWTYNGFSAQNMANRITSNYERALSSDVDDIERIESQSLNGVSVVKIFSHPGVDINRAIAEAASNSASILHVLPPGTLPPTSLPITPRRCRSCNSAPPATRSPNSNSTTSATARSACSWRRCKARRCRCRSAAVAVMHCTVRCLAKACRVGHCAEMGWSTGMAGSSDWWPCLSARDIRGLSQI
ncbi:AcrB/AcrD/AcrF family protein [Paraburkholderia sp. BL6665CI2N2]|nr:AcrB/AcrD/AcrF family protein [Paraburkholderia sp. BL6665CI2N2]